ncbi:MAG: lysophospholipid acyltransferase family protein, partial [Planctomycetes bacterium]|nr:lysophospholipid acyltransferase family protein [Planctomycetota bacterium]
GQSSGGGERPPLRGEGGGGSGFGGSVPRRPSPVARQAPAAPTPREGRSRLVLAGSAAGFALAGAFAAALSPSWLLALGRLGALALYAAMPDLAAALRDNARRILGPGSSRPARGALARGVLASFARFALEVVLSSRRPQERVECPGAKEHFERARAAGKGIVCATLHMGNYEVGPVFLAGLERARATADRDRDDARATPDKVRPLAILYSGDPVPSFERARSRFRGVPGLEEIAIDRTPFFGVRVLSILRQGGLVLLAGDIGDPKLEMGELARVPFFGEPAPFPIWPARLSIASGAPILPSFCVRAGGGYRLEVEPPIFPGAFEDPRELLARLVAVFEEKVRRYPDQWLVIHRYWRDPSGYRFKGPSQPVARP